MSAPVGSPDPSATRAHAADWLELMAFAQWPSPYYAAQYVSALTMEENDPDEDPSLDDEDPEILDAEYTDLLERATDEIRWRASVLGGLYPFELVVRGRTWSLRHRRAGSSEERTAQDAYVACLLMSAARHGRLDGMPQSQIAIKMVADQFQAIVHLVSPALVGGQSFWIAFPRPEGDDYDPALRRLVKLLGAGKVKESGPPSQTSNKDGGVDIVAWRAFPDMRSNILLTYGQVATGKGWREKSVKNKLESHFHKWMEDRPTFHYIPSMFIPHVMHESIRATGDKFELEAKDNAHTLEHSLGVVIDRIRMTALTVDAVRLRRDDPLEGAALVMRVRRWLRDAGSSLRRLSL